MDVNFVLAAIGVPDYLILRARATDADTAEVTRTVIGPAPTGNLNFLITGLDPKNYFFDLYESVDGAALTELLGIFTYDVRNEKITDEVRFYVVGSGINNSPNDTDTTIDDDYLDGKTITAFAKRGIGELVPDGLFLNSEWSRAGTVISLLGDMDPFRTGETYVVRLTYFDEVEATASTQSLYKGIKTITGNTLLDNTYRNNFINLDSVTSRLVVQLEDITGVPDGTFWHFGDFHGGAQYQTKITMASGAIPYNGYNLQEFWVGKNEECWLEKQGTKFELRRIPKGTNDVGRHSAETHWIFPNSYPEDFGLWSADDLPRLWWWIGHVFPDATYYIVDDNLDSIGYTRPLDVNGFPYKAGLFIVSFTKRLFRMPDTRTFSEQASASFAPPFNVDPLRLYDKPGGYKPAMLLRHVHNTMDINTISDGVPRWLSKTGSLYNYSKSGSTPGLFGGKNSVDNTLITGYPRTVASDADISGTEQSVNNFSVIYHRYV